MHDDLEQLISRQPLREPPASLDRRIGADCRDRRSVIYRYAPMAAAVAACFLVAAMVVPRDAWRRETREATPAHVSVGPVERGTTDSEMVHIDQVWSRVTPGQIVLTTDDRPLRPLRVQSVRTQQWIDEAANVRIELTTPEDHLVFVNAPIQ